MSLEHDAPRLTEAQRDRVLDIAARLQAQHDTTTPLDDLARQASEAGIDPRFVQEAFEAVRHDSPTEVRSRPEPFRIERWFFAEVLVAVAVLLAVVMNMRQKGFHDQGGTYALLFLPMAVLGYRSLRRAPFWFVPLTAYAVAYSFVGSGNPSIEGLFLQSSFTAHGPFVLLFGPLAGMLLAWIVQSWLADRQAWKLG